jgi:protoporphyrinogen/coproporphyrinogen III oxidase
VAPGPRYVVVGGGIAGLAAALRLRERAAEAGEDAEIVVVESTARLGGKLRTGATAGELVETGAEMFLVREGGGESAVLKLARRVGLGAELVHPAAVPAAVAIDGELRPIPGGTLLGIPADPSTVEGLAEAKDADRDEGRPLLAPGEDVAVGLLVRRRLGDQVVDRLVDPLLGGVYAGRADELSLAATMPGLYAAAQVHSTLRDATRAALAASPRPAGAPVFATVRGGLGRLVEAVAARAGVIVRAGAPVRELAPVVGGGWRLTIGSTRDPETLTADAVILAVPAAPAARLLAGVEPGAAAAVGVLEYASVALVTMALPPETELPALSGFLVPATEGYATKAVTFVTTKWPHLRHDGAPVLVRASLGRRGEEHVLRRTDEALAAAAHADLRALLGPALPDPVAVAVHRWGGGLPQYGVGHTARVAGARAALPATVGLAGAAYDGVGIAACVRSGVTVAEAVGAAIEESRELST